MYDLGCPAAIDDMVSLGRSYQLENDDFERKNKDSSKQE
jgi:hypothetical protein